MSAGFAPLAWSERSAQVVKMAPRVIWPSMPMFQSPTVKVSRSPEVASRSGTQADQDVRRDLPGAHGAQDDVREGREGRSLGGEQDERREEERQDDGRRSGTAPSPGTSRYASAASPRIASHPLPPISRRAFPRKGPSAGRGGETRPAKKTSTRSLYCSISSRSEEMKTMAAPWAQRSLSLPQM